MPDSLNAFTAQQFIGRIYDAKVVPVPTLRQYGETISEHLHMGVDMLWSPDTHEYAQLPQCIDLFEAARKDWGSAIAVDSGYRTYAHEKMLEAQGLKTAKFVSPHSVGSANDYKVLPGTYEGMVFKENIALRGAFRQAATDLKLPQPRIGHRSYGEAFIHVDYMFMLFAPYTSLPHPKDWPELSDEMRAIYTTTLMPSWEW